ncbi:MAG: AbrB family transcriptional regulator [Schleiferilactobacillus perolens]|uniref:AbrB family transcriptional regulator n=1 Tax=Schleiferilactobacillus perolens TaxID=100468 RepID=UPI0039EA6DEC
MSVKSRKQGTSIVVTIPAEFGVKPDTIFDPKKLPDGTIQFVPREEKYPDIWNDDPKKIAVFNREIGSQDDGVNYGRENVDY